MQYYLSLGVPKEKMVLGIPTYGRCFTLDDIEDHGVYAPAHKPGPAGPYIKIPGTLGDNEVGKAMPHSVCGARVSSRILLLPLDYSCQTYFALTRFTSRFFVTSFSVVMLRLACVDGVYFVVVVFLILLQICVS